MTNSNFTQNAWSENQPLTKRLPYEGYQDNDDVLAFTAYWDDLLVNCKTEIESIGEKLNPETTTEDWLDYLAPLYGFVGEYWQSKSWSVPVKRLFLQHSWQIWQSRGTLEILQMIVSWFVPESNFTIWTPKSFIAGQTPLNAELGLPRFIYHIVLFYGSQEFSDDLIRQLNKVNQLFGCSAYCETNVSYDGFYAGVSPLGKSVVFSPNYEF